MKQNVITIEQIKEMFKNEHEGTTTIKWAGFDVEVKKYISAKEFSAFVNSVVAFCFTDKGEYEPEFKEAAIKKLMVDLYTNIDLGKEESEWYGVIYNTDIIANIYAVINQVQFTEMRQAIDERLKHLSSANVAEASKAIDGIYERIGELVSSIDGVVSAVNPDELAKLMSTLSGGGFDPNKIVEAYMEKKERPVIKVG